MGSNKLSLSNAANTYNGVTSVNGSILNVNTLAAGTANSSIGNPGNTNASNLVIAGGILQHDAATVSITDRLFTIGGTSGDTATLDSSATSVANVMSFTNTGAIAFGNTNAHTLTLTGSNTGLNTLASTLGNNTGLTSLTKSGAGTWVLSGANAFGGGVWLKLGQLNINNATALGATGGTFAIGDTAGSTAVTIDNSTAGTLTDSNNNAQTWNQNSPSWERKT